MQFWLAWNSPCRPDLYLLSVRHQAQPEVSALNNLKDEKKIKSWIRNFNPSLPGMESKCAFFGSLSSKYIRTLLPLTRTSCIARN